MLLTSWSSQGATILCEDGRTITIAEGVPVSIVPQDIQVAPTPEATPDVAPGATPDVAPTPDATPETPAS
jgi:hypothetical protein